MSWVNLSTTVLQSDANIMLFSVDTRAVRAPNARQHHVGQLEISGTTVLYALPRSGAPDIEVVAFPGDAVANSLWQPLQGAVGNHPHAGGLLSVLHSKLSQAHAGRHALFVVEPTQVTAQGFAVFESLLPSTTASGEPAAGYNARGLPASRQLHGLLAHVWSAVAPERAAPAPAPLVVCGFSKGGVVCNQLLAEVAQLPDVPADQPGAAQLLARVTAVHLLDVGLSCRGAYLTDPAVATALGRQCAASELRVCLHGTPRQWRDPSRRWLGMEKERSLAVLRGAGVRVACREYFEDEPPSLEMHFRCVDAFDLALQPPAEDEAVGRLRQIALRPL